MASLPADGGKPVASKVVLVVDDDLHTLAALKVPLLRKGYAVTAVTNGEVAVGWLGRATPDLAILNPVLPGISGQEVCRRLRRQGSAADIPVIFLASRGSVQGQVDAQLAGGDLYVVKPLDVDRLVDLVEALLASPAPRAATQPSSAPGARRVLLVDDDQDSLELTTLLLERMGYVVATATGGEAALRWLDRQVPDLVLLDVLMPDLSGFDVCRKIRGDLRTRNTPVIFLSGRLATLEAQIEAKLAGSNDWLAKPIEPDRLTRMVHLLLKALPSA